MFQSHTVIPKKQHHFNLSKVQVLEKKVKREREKEKKFTCFKLFPTRKHRCHRSGFLLPVKSISKVNSGGIGRLTSVEKYFIKKFFFSFSCLSTDNHFSSIHRLHIYRRRMKKEEKWKTRSISGYDLWIIHMERKKISGAK